MWTRVTVFFFSGFLVLIFCNFQTNESPNAPIELGKKLFYDPILSANNTISCASCHSPFSAFSHNDHDLSHGIYDSIGFRNAPALFNLTGQNSFMWDGASHNLEVQALAPIHSQTEMGSSINEVIAKLKKDTIYKNLFREIYHDTSITGERVLKSLAQFQLTLISNNSKYDSVMRDLSQFDLQEKKGYLLFQKNCNSCHTEPNFTNYKFANNGLSIDSTLNDFGRYRITKKSSDSLKFKIPSLRNLSYTYPYMHDGRFKKLYQVLNHYTRDIKKKSFIDDRLKGGIPLTENEKVDIIAFLLTLNDTEFIKNKKLRISKESQN